MKQIIRANLEENQNTTNHIFDDIRSRILFFYSTVILWGRKGL